MKVDRTKLKKGNFDVPQECKTLIAQISNCTTKEALFNELHAVKTWDYGKCELLNWADVLDKLDDVLEGACNHVSPEETSDTSSWFLACDKWPNDSALDRELLLSVLQFSALLIENSITRDLYSSMEHLTTLLSSSNMTIVLAVVDVLYVFSKHSNFISRLVTDKKQALVSRLVHLAESWGGKENGFGLAACCQNLPMSHFPESATTLHFEYYEEAEETYTRKLKQIHVTRLDKLGQGTTSLMVSSLKGANLPKDKEMQLFNHIRLVVSFSDYERRLHFVEARLQAMSTLIYSNAAQDHLNGLLYSGFVEELVDLLELKDDRLTDLKATALRRLTAVVQFEGKRKLNANIKSIGTSLYHGFLPTLMRQCLQNRIDPESTSFPQSLTTALFSFLYHLASYKSGGEALVSCGIMESLIEVISRHGDDSQDHITFVTRAVRLVDLVMSLDMQSIQTYGAMNAFISRLQHEVAICRPFVADPRSHGSSPGRSDRMSDTANTSAEKLTKFHTGSLALDSPWRAELLESILKFVEISINRPSFSDTIRHIMAGSLPDSLKHIISNEKFYGPSIFLLGTKVVTAYISYNPSILSFLQSVRLTDIILQALFVRNVPATKEILLALPDICEALCLNTEGLNAVMASKPFEVFDPLLFSDISEDTATRLGSAVNKLIKLHMSFRSKAINGIIKLLAEVSKRGRVICHQKPISSAATTPTMTSIGAAVAAVSSTTSSCSAAGGAGGNNVSTKTVDQSTNNESQVIPLVDYIFNVMKFVMVILSDAEDGRCKEFVELKGLAPLLEILTLPILPVDFPSSYSCQAVADIFKLILLKNQDPQTIRGAFDLVKEELFVISRVGHSKDSFLLSELVKAFQSKHESPLHERNATPLLHALRSIHNIIIIFSKICESGDEDMTLSFKHWGSSDAPELAILNSLVKLLNSLCLECSILKGLSSNIATMTHSTSGDCYNIPCVQDPPLGYGDAKVLSDLFRSTDGYKSFKLAESSDSMETSKDGPPDGGVDMEVDGANQSLSRGTAAKEEKPCNNKKESSPLLQSTTASTEAHGGTLAGTCNHCLVIVRLIENLYSIAFGLSRSLTELFEQLMRDRSLSPESFKVQQEIAVYIAILTKIECYDFLNKCSPVWKRAYILSKISFISIIIFSDKEKPCEFILQKFIDYGCHCSLYKVFYWVITNYNKMDKEAVLNSEELPEGSHQLLDKWLILVEKLLEKVAECGYNKSVLNFRAQIQSMAFEAVTILWSKKLPTTRMDERLFNILYHIISCQTIFEEETSSNADAGSSSSDNQQHLQQQPYYNDEATFPKGPVPKHLIESFTLKIIPKCMRLLDSLPGAVYNVADVFLSEDALIESIIKLLTNEIKNLCSYLRNEALTRTTEDTSTPLDINTLSEAPQASQLTIRLHLLSHLVKGQNIACATMMEVYRLLDDLIKLLQCTQQYMCTITPPWVKMILLLHDMYEKMAISMKMRKQLKKIPVNEETGNSSPIVLHIPTKTEPAAANQTATPVATGASSNMDNTSSKNYESEGDIDVNRLSHEQTDSLIRYCVELIGARVEPDTLNACLRLTLRLTRDLKYSQIFTDIKGPKLLLALTEESNFEDILKLATLILWHTFEDEKALTYFMVEFIRMTLDPRKNPQELHNVMWELRPEVCRDQDIFKQVASRGLRINVPQLEKDKEEARLINPSNPQLKCMFPDHEVLPLGCKTKEVILVMLRSLAQTNPRSTDDFIRKLNVSARAQPFLPLISKSAIMRLINVLTSSYVECASFIATQKYNAGESNLITEDCSVLSFILDHLMPSDFSESVVLICQIATSNHSPEAQDALANEVKKALQRSLSMPECTDKHARIQAISKLIQHMSSIDFLAMIKNGLVSDLARVPHSLDLSSPNMATTVNAALNTLKLLSDRVSEQCEGKLDENGKDDDNEDGEDDDDNGEDDDNEDRDDNDEDGDDDHNEDHDDDVVPDYNMYDDHEGLVMDADDGRTQMNNNRFGSLEDQLAASALQPLRLEHPLLNQNPWPLDKLGYEDVNHVHSRWSLEFKVLDECVSDIISVVKRDVLVELERLRDAEIEKEKQMAMQTPSGVIAVASEAIEVTATDLSEADHQQQQQEVAQQVTTAAKVRLQDLLDNEALTCLLVLLFVNEPRLDTTSLHCVIKNLSNSAPIRTWIIDSLLSVLSRTHEQLRQDEGESRVKDKSTKPKKSVANQDSTSLISYQSPSSASTNQLPEDAQLDSPAWLNMYLHVLGSQTNVFKIHRSAPSKHHHHHTGKNTSITIHPQACPVVCRHVLDILIFLAETFPTHFLPQQPGEQGKSSDGGLMTPGDSKHKAKDGQSTSTGNSDFWESLVKLDSALGDKKGESSSQKDKSFGSGDAGHSLSQEGSSMPQYVTFESSPFGQLMSMLSHPVIQKSQVLTDRLLRVLKLISVGLFDNLKKPAMTTTTTATTTPSTATSSAVGTTIFASSNPVPSSDSTAAVSALTFSATTSTSSSTPGIYQEGKSGQSSDTAATSSFCIDLDKSTVLQNQLKLLVEILISSTQCSKEGFKDGTSLLLQFAKSETFPCDTILKLLVMGANKLGSTVCQHIGTLSDELANSSNLPGMSSAYQKGILQDRFEGGNIIVHVPSSSKFKSRSCELQLPSMQSLTNKGSSQDRLLRLLKIITLLCDRMKIISKRDTVTTTATPNKDNAEYFSDWPVLLHLDELWDTLGGCLLKLAGMSDNHAVLVLQPAVEAFFFVHSGKRDKPNIGQTEQQKLAAASSQDGCSSSPPIRPEMQKLISFAETHRTVLNEILRQSTVPLADGPFSVLVDDARVLDFDIKSRYFRQEIDRMDEGLRKEDLAVHVRRDHVFEDSFRELHSRTPEQWKNIFRIEFEGEEGHDAGGLLREWYIIIVRGIFNCNPALFCTRSDKRTYTIDTSSGLKNLSCFKFVGAIISKAIYDNKLLECYFTRSFYKHILGVLVESKDLEYDDPQYYWSLIETPVKDLEGATFTIDIKESGGKSVIRDLKKDGKNISVTEDNKEEYVKLTCLMRMTGAIEKQLAAFLEGFYSIIPQTLISIFNEQELELLISGLPSIDIEDLKLNTELIGYKANDLQIQWFWEALRSFNQADRAGFLQFVTGTSKVPLQGFAYLEGTNGIQKFQIQKDNTSTDRLPSASTCTNLLSLPVYGEYVDLRRNLLQAIIFGSEGFSFA